MNQQHLPVSSPPLLGSLGQRLRLQRLHRGISQEALAEALNVSARSIRRWEQDQSTPQAVARERLCHFFGLDSWSLLGAVSVEEAAPVTSSLWQVPLPRNPFFTGRQELLRTLHEKLRREHSMALTQSWAISGLGGIGKTQIALEYAYQYRYDYTAIFWVSAATQDTLLTGLLALGERLKVLEKDERDHQRAILMVKQWLAAHQDWLLILDNADDVSIARDVLPPEHAGHVLLTTRAQALGSVAQRIEVETMGMAEGALFLLHRARLLALEASLDHVLPDQRAAAEAIVTEMDFLPLALDQAGAYIDEVGCSLLVYLELYRAHRVELLRRRGHVPGDHPESVFTTWSLNFQRIEQANAAAGELLRLCAFLDPDAIAEELLSEGSAALGPLLCHTAADALALNEAIKELRTFSLVQRDPEARVLRIHRLVQAVLRDAMGGEERRRWAERAVRATSMVFPENAEIANRLRCQRYLPHAQACSVLIQEHAFVFAEAAWLLQRTANYLYEVALYKQAEPLYQQALHIWEQTLGPEHPDAVCSLNGLATLYRIQGKYARAEALFQQAIRLREQALGSEHPDVAHPLRELGVLYLQQGKYEQAEVLYQRVLSIREQALGSEHPDVAHPLNNLAILYDKQGKYEQAEVLYQRVLRLREQALGPEHPDVAQALNNLAILYNKQEKYEQAEALYQRALSIWEQAVGPEHPNVAHPLNNLGDLYRVQERYEQAEPLLQRALHIWEQALGSEHPNVAHPLNNLGDIYRAQEKYE
ncbi:MAG: helix-turn-helix transcriptional regulator [Ktedonobacteraceae bacterium]|nr:helix-turn-helix transcriptional regulator [Ktedonobacteraceae bacterium]